MDFWAQRCLEEIREAEEQKVAAAGHTTDRAMADTVMDFLFASQDATTSAVVWVTVLMADYPDVLQKVRAWCHLVTLVSGRPSWVSQLGHATLFWGGWCYTFLDFPRDFQTEYTCSFKHCSMRFHCHCAPAEVLSPLTAVLNAACSLLRSMYTASMLLMYCVRPLITGLRQVTKSSMALPFRAPATGRGL